MPKQLVVVEAWVPGAASDAHPEHPIYLPVPQPPDLGLHPEHPIYFPDHIWGPPDPRPTPPIYLPVPPPPDSGAHPEHPIYWPVHIWGPPDPRPEPPIELPPWVDGDLSDAAKQKLHDFLYGNLPPYESVQPV